MAKYRIEIKYTKRRTTPTMPHVIFKEWDWKVWETPTMTLRFLTLTSGGDTECVGRGSASTEEDARRAAERFIDNRAQSFNYTYSYTPPPAATSDADAHHAQHRPHALGH